MESSKIPGKISHILDIGEFINSKDKFETGAGLVGNYVGTQFGSTVIVWWSTEKSLQNLPGLNPYVKMTIGGMVVLSTASWGNNSFEQEYKRIQHVLQKNEDERKMDDKILKSLERGDKIDIPNT